MFSLQVAFQIFTSVFLLSCALVWQLICKRLHKRKERQRAVGEGNPVPEEGGQAADQRRGRHPPHRRRDPRQHPRRRRAAGAPLRSEEHTSELQSLMRISYAVFCLKKKR